MALVTWSHRRRWLRVVGAFIVVAALIWVGGLTWNWVSSRDDLTAEEVQGILSTRVTAADCGPTERLWSVARHWDYRCELFARLGPEITAPLAKEPLGVVLVRVDEHAITGRRLPGGKVIPGYSQTVPKRKEPERLRKGGGGLAVRLELLSQPAV